MPLTRFEPWSKYPQQSHLPLDHNGSCAESAQEDGDADQDYRQEAAKRLWRAMLCLFDGVEAEFMMLPECPINITIMKPERALKEEVTILENVCWKEIGLLFFVWIASLELYYELFRCLSMQKQKTCRCNTSSGEYGVDLIMTHYNNDEGTNEVSLHGGQVILWRYSRGKELLFTSSEI
uniref:Sulfite exporter TauE/SafE family protein 3-like n=1 Tax=Tanacetum cinerariifolium TaxID=118510 RepID=A0A699GV56_TANCI|nr:sulfite exporter TauE/SafE family protein 3-like [Tanacetum cinerariifolium]